MNNSFLVKIYLLVFVNIFCKTILIAQVQAFITGEVKDSSGTPVENVAVSLKANSGKPFAYSFSGANGKFQINTFLPDTGRYNLEFRNIGYSTNSIAISVLSNKKFTWDQVVIMQRNFKALPDIIIKSDPGVVIKKDTIEYLAKNFKTN